LAVVPAQLGIVGPIEQDQGALAPPALAQGACDRVLARIAGEVAQHTDARTVSALIEGASRSVSSQSSSMAQRLTVPATSGRSVGQGAKSLMA
jgi:ubiquinone biosynthesis protein UbiJ